MLTMRAPSRTATPSQTRARASAAATGPKTGGMTSATHARRTANAANIQKSSARSAAPRRRTVKWDGLDARRIKMEITTTTLVMILAGMIALAISVIVFIYFSGGTGVVAGLLLGLLP